MQHAIEPSGRCSRPARPATIVENPIEDSAVYFINIKSMVGAREALPVGNVDRPHIHRPYS
jgi:hypothetical protein